MNNRLYVQYGCGWDAPQEWINFDSSPTLRVERIPLVGRLLSSTIKNNPESFPANVRYGDIVKGLPLPKESCDGIYCSHVLEHLSLEDFRCALVNTHNLLKPNGIFRLVIPDLAFYIHKYIARSDSSESAFMFMTETGLGELRRPRKVLEQIKYVIGNSRHRWMWDWPSLAQELNTAQFVEIRRAKFNDSSDPSFKEVEREDRWNSCLGVECRCP